jgi:hypothetical protein
MNEWLLFTGDYALAPINIPALVLGLLLSFLLGQLVAWVYMLTHSGLSYSRSFVKSLVVTPVIVALVMAVLANNIVTAFGLMAVFAIVRFRNILRDTLDTSYVLGVIVIGMGCGTQKFATAAIGTLLIAGILVYLWYCSFGSRHRYDLILNLRWSRSAAELEQLNDLLMRHTMRLQLASQRASDTGTGADFSFRLLLRDPNRANELLAELQSLPGVSRVTALRAEEESEI